MTRPIKTPLFRTEPRYYLDFRDSIWRAEKIDGYNLVRGDDGMPLVFETAREAETCAKSRSLTYRTPLADYTVVEVLP